MSLKLRESLPLTNIAIRFKRDSSSPTRGSRRTPLWSCGGRARIICMGDPQPARTYYDRMAPVIGGRSEATVRMLADSALLAPTPYPVLILGETGTGKTMLAGYLHELSGREGAFVKESAAAIPSGLETSHLCGHSRGAFTGALADRQGLLEAAHHGTFFLDEVGTASAAVQRLLLQVLDDGRVRRIGESRVRPLDIRFLAATNEDLRSAVRERRFRRDLVSRFGYSVIRVPPLRERRDEVLPLAEAFLKELSGLPNGPDGYTMSTEVQGLLESAPWEENIRQLESVCRYAALAAAAKGVIGIAELPPLFMADLGDVPRARFTASLRDRARQVLRDTNGNKSETARRLGISRRHLYRLLAG